MKQRVATVIPFFCCILIGLAIFACTENHFKHDIETDAKPWTETPWPSADGQVTFAVIGDLNSGQRDIDGLSAATVTRVMWSKALGEVLSWPPPVVAIMM